MLTELGRRSYDSYQLQENNANQTTSMEKIKGQNASFAVKRLAWLSSMGESSLEITEIEVEEQGGLDVEMRVASL
jgi:hypothetical protein